MSKYGVFSDPYFPAFGLNTERYGVFVTWVRIYTEYTEYLLPGLSNCFLANDLAIKFEQPEKLQAVVVMYCKVQ